MVGDDVVDSSISSSHCVGVVGEHVVEGKTLIDGGFGFGSHLAHCTSCKLVYTAP